jgi:hypothetical protein
MAHTEDFFSLLSLKHKGFENKKNEEKNEKKLLKKKNFHQGKQLLS